MPQNCNTAPLILDHSPVLFFFREEKREKKGSIRSRSLFFVEVFGLRSRRLFMGKACCSLENLHKTPFSAAAFTPVPSKGRGCIYFPVLLPSLHIYFMVIKYSYCITLEVTKGTFSLKDTSEFMMLWSLLCGLFVSVLSGYVLLKQFGCSLI